MDQSTARSWGFGFVVTGLTVVILGFVLMRRRLRFLRVGRKALGTVVEVREATPDEDAKYMVTPNPDLAQAKIL